MLSILLVVGLSLAQSPLAFAGLLALSGAAVNLPVGLYFVYIDRLTDAATAGTSLAVLATFSQVGNLVAPFGGGWLIDSISWGAAFGFAATLAVAGIITITLDVRMARR